MARNTRTFADLDLNFQPHPLSLETGTGNGTLTFVEGSATVTGINSLFKTYLSTNYNLYAGNKYLGKVKSITNNTSLVLYNAASFSGISQSYTYTTSGDLVLKYDEDAIKASVRNLVLTQNYERPFHSEIGSQIRGLLFEPASPMLDIMLKRAITDTIINFEPRVRLIDVLINVSPDNNEVYAKIEFAIVNTTKPLVVDLILKRTR